MPNETIEYKGQILGTLSSGTTKKIRVDESGNVTVAGDILEQQMGKHGFEFISDTSSHVGNFVALQIIEDSTVSAITTTAISGNSLVGVIIPIGITVPFPFTSITLSSGKAIAYKG